MKSCRRLKTRAHSKSKRSIEDSQAPMGMGATNELDRVFAAVGILNGVSIKFESSLDVPRGGVLSALPAMLVCGLLSHTEKHFHLRK